VLRTIDSLPFRFQKSILQEPKAMTAGTVNFIRQVINFHEQANA
jgi:hypothetical protein